MLPAVEEEMDFRVKARIGVGVKLNVEYVRGR